MNKIIIIKKLCVGVILFTFLSSCSSKSCYTGDGNLIDKGPFAASERYILDLGVIDLNKAGIFTYRIEKLPSLNFVIGIELKVPSEYRNMIDGQAINPIVLIELIGPQGEQVIQNQSPLKTWTWSVRNVDNTAFVYRREQPSTFFTPIANGRYELKLRIVHPDSNSSKYTAHLIAKTGGWK